MTNIKRLLHSTPKMSDNAYSLHCYDTADNNVKVHWHYRSPKCARPGRISGTLCLNAPFARVCENSYLYDMADVIIKCRVTFGKKCSTIALNHILFVRDLYFRHRKSFSLKRAHYGHSPLPTLALSLQRAWTPDSRSPARLRSARTRPRESWTSATWPRRSASVSPSCLFWLSSRTSPSPRPSVSSDCGSLRTGRVRARPGTCSSLLCVLTCALSWSSVEHAPLGNLKSHWRALMRPDESWCVMSFLREHSFKHTVLLLANMFNVTSINSQWAMPECVGLANQSI